MVHGYKVIRSDRNHGGGGGCATFIKQDILYRVLEKVDDQEYIYSGGSVGEKGEGG